MCTRYDELSRALENARKERDIGAYLKENLELVKVLNEHSWNHVITRAEFPIGIGY